MDIISYSLALDFCWPFSVLAVYNTLQISPTASIKCITIINILVYYKLRCSNKCKIFSSMAVENLRA